jgi:hypothetical protein
MVYACRSTWRLMLCHGPVLGNDLGGWRLGRRGRPPVLPADCRRIEESHSEKQCSGRVPERLATVEDAGSRGKDGRSRLFWT